MGVISTELVKKGVISWLEAVKHMSSNPAAILQIPAGTLGVGAAADITIIDPDLEWIVAAEEFRSLSRNSPYIGRKLTGRAVRTIVGGKIVFDLKQ